MPVRIELRWRVLMAASGKILLCELYEHPDGIEVRCAFNEGTLIHSQVDGSLENARRRATLWLDQVKRTESCDGLQAGVH